MKNETHNKMKETTTISIEQATMPKPLYKWIQEYAEEYKTTISDVLGEIFWVFREYKATDMEQN